MRRAAVPHREERDTAQESLRSEEHMVKSPDVQRTETEEAKLDFDSALNQAEQREREDFHVLTRKALSEMEILLQPAYMHKLKLFKQFFAKPEYTDILRKPEFQQELAQLLAGSDLKKVIYDYMIDYYRLRGVNRNDLMPESKALYDVLNRKRGITPKKNSYLYYGVPAGILAGLKVGFRQAIHWEKLIGTLVLCVAAVMVMAWVYKKIYENHSSIFAQFILAVFLLVSQFLVIMTEFYGTAFGSVDAGITVAVFLFLGAAIWMAVLLVAAIVQKIRRKI